MSFQIQYNIKIEALRRLELISKVDGNLQVLRMNPEWAHLLEHETKIKEAISSIGVEGTVLSIDQAKAITTGNKDIKVGEKEEREFRGYYESLQFIKEQIPQDLNLRLLLTIHEKITQGDEKAWPGKIKNTQNYIKSRGKIVYSPPPPEQMSFVLKEFFNWFNKSARDDSGSPIIAAAICHFWFVWIHPFKDGNGRVARLLTTFLLLKRGSEGTRYFALSDYYNQHKDEYYDALEETNKCDPKMPAMNFNGNLTTWINFFISSYLEQMQSIKKVTNRILQLNIRVDHLRKDGLITESHNKVLNFLYAREKASYKELTKYLSVSNQRVEQILRPLRKAQILVEEQIGSTKWFMLGSPENEPDETILVHKKVRKATIRKKKLKTPTQRVFPIFEE